MVDNNDGLLREVEEELRRERYLKLWEQYGTYVLAAAALIVASVGGYKFWESQTIAAAQSAGAEYQQALSNLEAGKAEEATKAFQNIAENGPDGYATLARLQLAGAQIKAGKGEDAQAVLNKVAGDNEANELLQDFAKLQAVGLNVGDADFTDIKNRLNALSAESSPWRSNALELLALAAYDAGKLDDARELFRTILSSPSSTRGTLERANNMMALITAKELADKSASTSPPSAADNASPAAKPETPEAKDAPKTASEPAAETTATQSDNAAEKKE
jgi:hypothetical protein